MQSPSPRHYVPTAEEVRSRVMAVQRNPLCPAARASWVALSESEAQSGESGVFLHVPEWMSPMKVLTPSEAAEAKAEAGAYAYITALESKGRKLRAVDLVVSRALTENQPS